MKLISKEWLNKAKEDLDVVGEIISRKHLTGMVAFHCQQAVEKTFKSLIEEFENCPFRQIVLGLKIDEFSACWTY